MGRHFNEGEGRLMNAVGNWVLEQTNTVGTGIITLAGATPTFASFANSIPAGTVWYSIQDTNGNRESGIGTFDGDAILVRTTVQATLIGTTYNDVNPTAISLSGDATVACTFSAESYEDLLDQISNISTSADLVSYDPTGDTVSVAVNVQNALIEHANAITAVDSRVDAISIDGGYELVEEYFDFADFDLTVPHTVVTTATAALIPSVNNLDVYVSGVIQRFGVDFDLPSNNSIRILNKTLGAADYILMKAAVPSLVDTTLRTELLAEGGADRVGKVGGGTVQDFIDASDTTLRTDLAASTGTDLVGYGIRTLTNRLRDLVNIVDYGGDKTGVLSSVTALAAAVAALPSYGGDVFVPPGNFLIDDTMPEVFVDNMRIVGLGAASRLVIDRSALGSFAFGATSKNNIGMKDLTIESNNGTMLFTLCDGVTIENCIGEGLLSTGVLSQYFVLLNGCQNILVTNPNLDNYNNGVYLGKSSSTPCGIARINGGLMQQTASDHGTGSYNNPTGVYAYEVEYCYVDGVTFKNIKPSISASAPIAGYGVYEGDGTTEYLKIISVKNCLFTDDDGFTSTRKMVGVLASVALVGIVDNNEFTGNFRAIDYGCRDFTISNNKFIGSYVVTAPTTLSSLSSVVWNRLVVRGNEFSDTGSTLPPLIVSNSADLNGLKLELAIIDSNTFDTSHYGSMWFRFVDYAVVTNNVIRDCNTSGDTNDQYKGGINFVGSRSGFIAGNTVMNLVSGKASHGVVSGFATHQLHVTEDNKFIGMVTAAFYNGYTTVPDYGTWAVGDRVKLWAAAAAGIPAYQCTTKGTMGTLNSGATTGSITTGTSTLTVSSASGLLVGQWLAIVGVTGPLRITAISGTTITLHSTANATVAGAAVSFSAAVFKAEAALAA